MRNKVSNYFFLLFFFSLNFEVWDPLNTGGFFSISKLTGFLYVISIIPKLNDYLIIPQKLKSIVIPIIIFFLWLTIISIFYINRYSSAFFDFSLFQNIILFIFILNQEKRSPGIIEKGFFYFFLGSLVLALFYFFGIGTEINSEGRVSIFGDNENIIGIRMVVSILFVIHFITSDRKNRSKVKIVLLLLSAVPLIILLINSGSRLSFFSFILGIGAFFIMQKSKSPMRKIIFIFFGIISTFYIYQFAFESEVLGARLSKTAEDGNLSGRDEIWKFLLPLISDNAVVGVGKTGYAEYTIKNVGEIQSPHNVFIEIIAYSGIIGLILYITPIWRMVYASYLYFKKSNALIPFLFFIPILGIMLSAQILNFKLAWVIFAYAASRTYYLKKLSKT